jgi:hypothetical protein
MLPPTDRKALSMMVEECERQEKFRALADALGFGSIPQR